MKSDNSPKTQSFTAILSGVMYDIPLWMRGLLVVAGFSAVVVVVIASLTGNKEYTIEVDKLLHFGGYTTLAVIFVLGLRPIYCFPAIVLLGLLGFAIEYLQPFNGRSRDMSDGVANLIGLTVGTVIGLVLRLLLRAIRTSATHLRLLRRRRTYSTGAIILREGTSVTEFYVIERGEVQLTRKVDGRPQVVGTLGPGDVFGLLGVLQAQPQYTTVEAVDDVTAYGVALAELLETSSGKQEPIAAVLKVLAKYVRALADRVVESEKLIQ
jgi:CRP-like cAMP-binding protein